MNQNDQNEQNHKIRYFYLKFFNYNCLHFHSNLTPTPLPVTFCGKLKLI